MDGIAIWILFLIFLPFFLFFWKMLVMAWKSFLFSKKIKSLSDEIESFGYQTRCRILSPFEFEILVLFRVFTTLLAMASNFSNSFNWTSVPIFPPIVDSPPPPFVVYPGDSSVSRGYAVYGCFIAVLVLVFIAIMIKISISRKRLQARNANIRQNIRARQNQLSTLSRSVDSNTNNSNNVDQNRRRRHGSDETLKLDLPPTYEEVMSNSPQIREQPPITLTIPPGAGETLQSTTDTHASVSIEIVTDPITQRRRSLDP